MEIRSIESDPIGLLLGMLLLMAVPMVSQAELNDITVMALGPVDGRAVIKDADGKMQVLNVGDKVQGTKAIVKQILVDRLVVTDYVPGDPPMMQDVWIYKPGKPGEKSRIQRLDRQGPPREVAEVQRVIPLERTKQKPELNTHQE